MKIVTISGAHSGVGKTMVAERLLWQLKDWSALKVTLLHNGACPAGRGCGVCARLSSRFSIVGSKKIIEEQGSDTCRFRKAGAGKVLWLRAKPEGLKQGLKKAISRFKDAKGLLIEGTSVLKYLKPDLAIFVKKENSILKDSAKQIVREIDWVMVLR